ncbi:MAG: AAA family ATPase, partial [Chloroflexota bacterium]|nr:AAA family ATPase [Chloroflexota bacterium]
MKELLRVAVSAEKPVHVLLAGPPALAKSLFLWDLERAAPGRTLWLVGSGASKAGLWDMVAERQPKI